MRHHTLAQNTLCVLYGALLSMSVLSMASLETWYGAHALEILFMVSIGIGVCQGRALASVVILCVSVGVVYTSVSLVRCTRPRRPVSALYPAVGVSVDELDTGDILLFHDDSVASRWKQLLFKTLWSHVALLLRRADGLYVLEMDHHRVSLVSWAAWKRRWLGNARAPVVAWRGLRGIVAPSLEKVRVPAIVAYPTALSFCLSRCGAVMRDASITMHCAQLVVHVLANCWGVLERADLDLLPGDFSVGSGRLDRLVVDSYRYLPERALEPGLLVL